ncbi:speckle targeted PIP5K1A-regulated poly(A) polymerase-like isoform X2 [Lycorma delicatula]|uniref:speckle targeted PIP5K1A-regulated poly(A) polymerase-like isoform X2 n=1 Tax=Lycorma delicatula TaxID=130591 RepID=UPI003F50FF84
MFNMENNKDPNFCSLCNVTLQSREVAEQHFNGKLHKALTERLKKRQKSSETGIFIRRNDIITIKDEELCDLFSQFGQVVQIMRPPPDKNYCIVKFSDSEAVQKLLKTSVSLRGKQLPISPEKPFGSNYRMKITTKKSPPATPIKRNRSKTKAVTERDISIELPDINVNSFDEAVHDFIKTIEAEPGLEDKYKLVCADLESTFCELLPGVKARLFGSTVTGLAFKESDLDIFMECPKGQPPKDFVLTKTSIMHRCKKFSNIFKIHRARVPIIRCVHKQTSMTCDISFSNRLGLEKTNLVKFMFSLDDRIKPSYMLLKSWAKEYNIIGPAKFCSFTLQLLFIFYLQQLNEPILPPVKLLQDGTVNKLFCEGWEYSFCNDTNKIPKTKNNLTIKEILKGFFKFYADFNYQKFIICPLLGKPLSKEIIANDPNLEKNKSLALVFKNYKNFIKDKSRSEYLFIDDKICVQDPVILNFNSVRHCHKVWFDYFVELCIDAYKNAFDDNNSNEKIFAMLFSYRKYNDKPVVKVRVKQRTVNKRIYLNKLDVRKVTAAHKTTRDYKVEWFKKIKRMLFLILKNVCKFEFSVHKNYKNDIVAIMSTFLGKPFQNISFIGKGYCYMFENRDLIRLLIRRTETRRFVDELEITRRIYETRVKGDEKDYFKVNINIICYPNGNNSKIKFQCSEFKESYQKKSNICREFIMWMNTNIIEILQLAFDFNTNKFL